LFELNRSKQLPSTNKQLSTNNTQQTTLSMELILLLFIFVLAALGFELIAKVPSQLHTPLMSGSNAISGITVVGAILAVNTSSDSLSVWLGFTAIVLATVNVVGGYMVTDRMLGMFKKKK
jgi:NAD(P) transhydrogenase subunit alpha